METLEISGSRQPAKKAEPRRHMQSMVITSIAIVAIIVFLNVVSESESFSLRSVYDATSKGQAEKICSAVCTQRRTKRSESSSSVIDLLDSQKLIERVEASKAKLLAKLKKDYGEYFEPIFFEPETGRYRPIIPVTDDGISLERLKRKLMIKILSAQSQFRASRNDSDFHGCYCSDGGDEVIRADEVVEFLDPEDSSLVLMGLDGDENSNDGLFEKYVWATGGHSAAAGHGNLYNETYTSYMAADVEDVFAAVGIQFEARNYAMGGTDSATLVSMCWKEIFGEDVDFFSWDYGMTDGRNPVKSLHYAYRGMISSSRPAMAMLHLPGRGWESMVQILKDLQEMGGATFYADEDYMKRMREGFPDSAGIDSNAIDALPEYVRNYKCGDSIEKGDPFCGTDKYTKWGCSKRFKQTSWHPGFKDHAVVGHGLGLFLVETLLDTLRDLNSTKVDDEEEDASRSLSSYPELLMSQLKEEDDKLHKKFKEAELPAIHNQLLDLKDVNLSDGEASIDNSIFYTGPSMCHTARLPSQTRYHGILTNTDQVGFAAPVGEEKYYVGFGDEKKAKRTAAENSEIRLVYQIHRERELECEGVIVKPDYPDFWFSNSMDGWTKLTFPNAAEKRFYRYDPKQHQGIMFLHWKTCDWGKCPDGFLNSGNMGEDGFEMRVNSQEVDALVDVGQGATIIKGKETGFHFEPDSNGQYTIELKVNKENSFVEIADFVFY